MSLEGLGCLESLVPSKPSKPSEPTLNSKLPLKHPTPTQNSNQLFHIGIENWHWQHWILATFLRRLR